MAGVWNAGAGEPFVLSITAAPAWPPYALTLAPGAAGYTWDGNVLDQDFPGGTNLTTVMSITFVGVTGVTGSIGVSDCPILESVDISSLRTDVVGGMEISGNESLASLDVSGNDALQNLNCVDNALTVLNISGCTALTVLRCSDNALASLDVSELAGLEILQCFGNPLTTLDVSENSALEELYCGATNLTTLDVSANIALLALNCSGIGLDEAAVDAILAALEAHAVDNGTVTLLGNAPPGAAGLLSKTALEGRGWTVDVD